jgi:hypothetical protein
MEPVPVQPRALDAPEFIDGLGERTTAVDSSTGESVEVLRLRSALTTVPSFEFALRERAARLANFRHTYFARVRRVDRLSTGGLGVVSDHVAGFRLSQMLHMAAERRLVVDTNAALCLVRQLLPAIALLHENARDVAHGALAPERLIVTPHARVVVAEYVLGSALEQLQFSHDRLWKEYRIAMPPTAGAPRFDHRADVMQIGVISLALILGRPLGADDLARIPELLAESTETTAGGARQPLSQGLRGWLARALQIDPRRPFMTARDAQAALDQLLGGESGYVASTIAVEAFITRCVDSVIAAPSGLEPLAPVSAPVLEPPQFPAEALSAPEFPDPLSEAPLEAALAPPPVALPPVAPLPAVPAASAPAPAAPPAPRTQPSAPAVPAAPPARPSEPTTPPPGLLGLGGHTPQPERFDLDIERLQASFGQQAGVLEPVVPEEAAYEQDEPDAAAHLPRKRRGAGRLLRVAMLVILLSGAIGAGVYYGKPYFAGAPAPAQTGLLVVDSAPKGVPVIVDGVEKGITPLRLSLAPGPHIVELRGSGTPRVLPVTMTAGATLSQFVEFAAANTPTSGELDVRSDPPGAEITIDGQTVGAAPMLITNLAPGRHTVVLARGETSVQHNVSIEAGSTAMLVAPLAAAGPPSGWVSIAAPFAMQVFEGDRLIGTTETDKIMVPAGRHTLEIVSEALSFRVRRVVQVQPGRTATVGIELPNGTVNINAQPWAEVFVDNRPVGETPIGNLSLPIGPHEVVFRHPQFGERRQAISVTAGSPVRLSVDMRK